MVVYRLKCIFAIGLVFAFGGCFSHSELPIPSKTVRISTATYSPTNTPHLVNTSTITLNSSLLPPTLTPEPIAVSGWFPIPRLTQPDTIDFSAARSFKGLKIPPLPDDLVIEFYASQPYGEVPPDTIFYKLYLIRKGNTRMLWLGIPFKETVGCCGQETPHRIYDSIPFPPIETDNLLIPFICTRNYEPDLFLVVVAEPPEKGASATSIRYAWRIDPASTSLKPVSTEGIECSPNW